MSFDHGLLVVPVKGFTVSYLGNSVTLRSPEKGFKRIYDTQMVIHRTKGGQLRTFRDPDWYMTLKQELTFKALSKTQIDTLRTIYEDAAGKTVGIVDCENRGWTAFLSEPVVVTMQTAQGCSYEVTFTFLAVFSQPPFNPSGGYTLGGGAGAPPNNSVPVIGRGNGDFTSPTSKRILSPTGAFLKGPTGNQLVHS